MSKKPAPDKKELAKYRAFSDLGLKPTQIAKRLNRSHHTVIKYLNSDVYNDPVVKEMVRKIRECEITKNTLLTHKADLVLDKFLENQLIVEPSKIQAIPVIAVKDRAFQQNRLLQGFSTQNIDYNELVERYRVLKAKIIDVELVENQEDDDATN